jgi:uncharacterized protein
VIIADTSALLALFNRGDEAHQAVASFVATTDEPFVVSPFVIAELDYLIMTRIGVAAEVTMLCELAGGAYDLPTLDAQDLRECADVVSKYADQRIGVTDASIVVLAKRFQTNSILTLDHRHFGVVRSLDAAQFILFP